VIADGQALALAMARRRAARDRSAYPAEALAEIESTLEELRLVLAENEDLREQLAEAVRRVALRCAGAACGGNGVYYPTDGERACIACAGRPQC